MGFTVANGARTAFGFAAAMLLISGCSDCKENSSCLPRGTYIDANELLGASSAKICFDDDCKTLVPGRDDGGGGGSSVDGNVTNGFYRSDWTDGWELMLTIEVYNSAGAQKSAPWTLGAAPAASSSTTGRTGRCIV